MKIRPFGHALIKRLHLPSKVPLLRTHFSFFQTGQFEEKMPEKKFPLLSISKEILPPTLPALNILYDALLQKTYPGSKEIPDYKNTLFVCGQHLLDSTLSLFKFLLELGADPQNFYVVGKSYSNNQEVIQWLKENNFKHQKNSTQQVLGDFENTYTKDIIKMWEKVLTQLTNQRVDRIYVLDDGGHVLNNIPEEIREYCDRIVAIEQTSSGEETAACTEYPTISIASSATKHQIEPTLIAKRVGSKLKEVLKQLAESENPEFRPREATVIGVVGLGHIGMSVLQHLLQEGYQNFVVCDKSSAKVRNALSLKQKSRNYIVGADSIFNLITATDIVIGCTGTDIIAHSLPAFELMRTPKVFISCSSKDIEFRSLLTYIQKHQKGRRFEPLADIEFQNGFKAPLKIIRGGFPINFDNSKESVPALEIQITRLLIAAAILQAGKILEGKALVKNYKLCPKGQVFVTNAWFKHHPEFAAYYTEKKRAELLDVDYVNEASGTGLGQDVALNNKETDQTTDEKENIKNFSFS